MPRPMIDGFRIPTRYISRRQRRITSNGEAQPSGEVIEDSPMNQDYDGDVLTGNIVYNSSRDEYRLRTDALGRQYILRYSDGLGVSDNEMYLTQDMTIEHVLKYFKNVKRNFESLDEEDKAKEKQNILKLMKKLNNLLIG